MNAMYILLKKITLSDMQINFDAFKEALEEFNCRPLHIGNDDYLILCSTLGGLTAIADIDDNYRGIIVETTRFII